MTRRRRAESNVAEAPVVETSAVAAPPTLPGGAWADRIVGSGMMAPDQFLANPFNFRIHSATQEAALEEVLDRVGWVRKVLVNRTTGHVLDGHLRVALGIRRNEPLIPFEEVELSDEEEKIVLASLDPIAGMAGTDATILATLLEGIQLRDDGPLLAQLRALADATSKAPAGFQTLDKGTVQTQHTCPSCGFEFS